MLHLVLEPLKMVGEGEYNVNVLSEIKASESYLGLDKSVIECQDHEPLFNCTTRRYHDRSLSLCECLPVNLGIGQGNKVVENKHGL